MELNEFVNSISVLCSYYERKEPKQSTLEVWHRWCHRIPSEPLTWIVRKIEEDYENFPRNLPGAVFEAYGEWQQANPDKMAAERYFYCPDCIEGLIFTQKIIDNMKYSYVFRCGRCRQSRTTAYPIAGRLDLLGEGYIVGGVQPTEKLIDPPPFDPNDEVAKEYTPQNYPREFKDENPF